MRKEIKFSKEQIQAIYNYINSNRSSSSNYENLKFLYNPNTPKDIYAKYNNIEYSFPSFLDVRKEGKMLANTSAYGHKLKKYD